MATVLVIGAGLLIRSFATALRVDPGIQTEGILKAGVTLGRYDDARQRAFFREVLERIRATPGVTDAELMLFAPLEGSMPMDAARQPGGDTERLHLNAVTPGLLPLLRVPLLEGRVFDRRDDETGELVAVLSESPVGQVLHVEQRQCHELFAGSSLVTAIGPPQGRL
jgi:hypothetical protein